MTTKSFIKTIGSKGLLADYNTEGKKLQTELTGGTYGIDISGNAATASAAASGSALETAINAKADGDNSVAIFDGYMRRLNESTGWRRLAYKQFNLTNTNLNALFRLYLFGSNNEHIGLGDLFVNVRFNSSGSVPELRTCYLMVNKPLSTSVKVKVIGVAGNAVVELWFKPLTFSMLTLTCLGNGLDVTARKKDWTFGRYLDATDPEPVEDIANNIYVFSGTVKRVQLDIDNPTSGNLVAMDEKGLVKDSGISITSTDIANWNSKMDRQTVGSTTEPVYLENGMAKVATGVATKDELNTKQNSLTAGENITIDGDTISSNQVFVAAYGTTTYQEIKDAYDAGKICICKNIKLIGTLYAINDSVIRFQYTKPNQGYIVSYSVSNNNVWTYNEFGIQSKLKFDTTPTEGSSNPVTSDGIKKALDSRIPSPISTTGTQVLKCINGVIQWVTE